MEALAEAARTVWPPNLRVGNERYFLSSYRSLNCPGGASELTVSHGGQSAAPGAGGECSGLRQLPLRHYKTKLSRSVLPPPPRAGLFTGRRLRAPALCLWAGFNAFIHEARGCTGTSTRDLIHHTLRGATAPFDRHPPPPSSAPSTACAWANRVEDEECRGTGASPPLRKARHGGDRPRRGPATERRRGTEADGERGGS